MIEYRITYKGISDPEQYVPEGDHSVSEPFEGSFEEALTALENGRRLAVSCGLPASNARLEARTVGRWEGEHVMRLVSRTKT